MDTSTIIRIKIKNLFTTYKGILTFILPMLLMLIVGSVVTNNKPAQMQPVLVASALANLMAIGFITNIFIVFGIEYIDIRKQLPKGNELTRGTLKLILWNMGMGIFNSLYLMFFVWIFTDVSHFMAPAFFTGSIGMDWGGIIFGILSLCVLSIAMTLLVSHFFNNKLIYAAIGFLYFLAFGYLAGGMFGPGATYWMMFPALFMPHTYIAHFLGAAFTGGFYNVSHLPTNGDIVSLASNYSPKVIMDIFKNITLEEWMNLLLHGTVPPEIITVSDSFSLSPLFVTQYGSNIWDLSVWHPEKWTYQTHSVDGVIKEASYKMYNNFYQINAINIFLPLVIAVGCGSSFWVIKNK